MLASRGTARHASRKAEAEAEAAKAEADAHQRRLAPTPLVGDADSILTEEEYAACRASVQSWAAMEETWSLEFNTPMERPNSYYVGDEEEVETLPTCCKKGDCSKFPNQALAAGARAGSLIAAWVRKQGGLQDSEIGSACEADNEHVDGFLSVWSFSAVDRSPTESSTEEPREIVCGYVIVAHVLLSPVRVIVVPLESVSGGRLAFTWTDDSIPAFQLLYAYLDTLAVNWDTCGALYCNEMAWGVEGWSSIRVSATTRAGCIWKWT